MSIDPLVQYSRATAGKVTVATVVMGVFLFSLVFFINARADDTAVTQVGILNSPPVWIEGPYEDPASTPTNPTNEGDSIIWKAMAEDPNAHDDGEGGTYKNDFYLVICKTEADQEGDHDAMIYDPSENTPPQCPGGEEDTWAVSSATSDGGTAEATYQVPDKREADEVNEWYAYICDNDDTNPRCNMEEMRQRPQDAEGNALAGNYGGSPFYVNYRPLFTGFEAPVGTDPGDTATWTSTSSSPNTYDGEEAFYTDPEIGYPGDLPVDHQVQLHICRDDNFDRENAECQGGAANTYATSSMASADVSVDYLVPTPKPNDTYEARGFLVDNFGFAAPNARSPLNELYPESEQQQGDNEPLVVNNVDPTVQASSVLLLNHTASSSDPLELLVAEDETEGFYLDVTTEDNNSCLTADAAEEMVDLQVNIYRSGIGNENCQTDGDYNASNCYPYAVEEGTYEKTGGWQVSCSPADSWSCEDDEQLTKEWRCTFPLWFAADPTDSDDPSAVEYTGEDWRAAVKVLDTDDGESDFIEGDTGTDLNRFLAFDLVQDSINFDQLEPGENSDTLDAVTDIRAVGNTGVDQLLSGTPMCPDFDVNEGEPFGCSTYDYSEGLPDDLTDTIVAAYQRFSTSTTAEYDAGYELPDLAGDYETHEGIAEFELALNVPKSTAVFNPEELPVGWGLKIPNSIVDTGVYTGENTFVGSISEATKW